MWDEISKGVRSLIGFFRFFARRGRVPGNGRRQRGGSSKDSLEKNPEDITCVNEIG